MAASGKKRVRNKSTGRNYRKEYDNYQSKPEQIKKRTQRNAARRKMVAEGKASKGDGKDVDHKRRIKSGGSNSSSNLRMKSKSANRSFSRKRGTNARRARSK